jgi:adenylate cyclase
MPYLIWNPGTPNEKVYELKAGLNTIGRDQCNNIEIEDDTHSLSRHHANITILGDSNLIEDCKSRNSTFVNEIKIERPYNLKNGDLIRCGNIVLEFTHSVQELASEQDSDLSIVKRFSPEQTYVVMQDLLRQDRPQEYQGSVLKLRQQDAEQRTVDKLKILLEVGKQLSSPEEPDRLLEKILELLFKIMNVDRAAILMVNQETGELECKAVKYLAGIPSDCQFYSTRITNFVRNNGDAILTADARIDKRFDDSISIVQQAIHASICEPLKPRSEVIGVLYVDNLSMANIYFQEDLEFLVGIANTAAIAIENANLYCKMQTEAVMRAKLERFFPHAVRKKIKESGNLEIIDTEVTALFCDISSFTEMSSKMEPRQVIEMLNEYFKVMVEDIVFRYEGTLEKYIGDALLAVWGAPYQKLDDASRAVKAAIEMQWAVHPLNEQCMQQRGLQIQLHIGLNTGKVAAGNIGSDQLIQYATIGDTTNVTSRICNVAKPGEILISQTTFEELKDQSLPIEKMPLVMVKGKDQPLQLYRVLWDRVQPLNEKLATSP